MMMWRTIGNSSKCKKDRSWTPSTLRTIPSKNITGAGQDRGAEGKGECTSNITDASWNVGVERKGNCIRLELLKGETNTHWCKTRLYQRWWSTQRCSQERGVCWPSQQSLHSEPDPTWNKPISFNEGKHYVWKRWWMCETKILAHIPQWGEGLCKSVGDRRTQSVTEKHGWRWWCEDIQVIGSLCRCPSWNETGWALLSYLWEYKRKREKFPKRKEERGKKGIS